jgi:hypothetical protein
VFALVVPVDPFPVATRRRTPGLPRIVLQEVLHTPSRRAGTQPVAIGAEQEVDPGPPHSSDKQGCRIRRPTRPSSHRHAILRPVQLRSTELVSSLVQHGQCGRWLQKTVGVSTAWRSRANGPSKQRTNRTPYRDQRLPQVVVHSQGRNLKRTPQYVGRQRTVVAEPVGQPGIRREQIRDAALSVMPDSRGELKGQRGHNEQSNGNSACSHVDRRLRVPSRSPSSEGVL